MSQEIQIGFPCPHYILEEDAQLSDDKQTLITSCPVGSEQSVRVLINNQYYVPASGLYSQGFLTSSKRGPYRIEKCTGLSGPDANLLIVETPSGRFDIRLPVSRRISLLDIQKHLRLSVLQDYVEITDYQGSLALKEKLNLGTQSWIRVSGKGAESLGFAQKGARGKEIYPPWDLIKQETIIPEVFNPRAASTRKIVFRKKLKGSPSIKASYTTLPSLCKRCKATFVENDYRFGVSGDLLMIRDENLLLQACLKAILTERGSNPYHVAYGSKIMTRIGTKIVGAASAAVQEDVVRAMKLVQTLQSQQRKFQTVTSKELLTQITSIDVKSDPNDPTLYFVDVVVRNGSGEPVNISITYTAPGAIALAGSNGMSLGASRAGV